jgi:hypothetical protein
MGRVTTRFGCLHVLRETLGGQSALSDMALGPASTVSYYEELMLL